LSGKGLFFLAYVTSAAAPFLLQFAEAGGYKFSVTLGGGMGIYFCDVVDGVRGAARTAFNGAARGWSALTGNARLEKRGLRQMDVAPFVGGGALVGLMAGCVSGMIVDGGGDMSPAGIETLFAVWGGLALGAPLVGGQIYSAYHASADDKRRALLAAPPAQKALPKPPEVPLI
jgi:hypothetical protein